MLAWDLLELCFGLAALLALAIKARALRSSLRERGFDLRVPPDDEHHASITMIELDDPGPVVDRLAERDIIVDFRPGALRASPYFYNTEEDIDIFVDALTELTRK